MIDIAPSEPLLAQRAAQALASAPDVVKTYDVLIVGAGLSGSLAAAVLGRAGYDVGLIDRYPVCPAQFRVEKVTGPSIDALRRLDLLDGVAAISTLFDRVVNVRHGRVIDETHSDHYGILYDDLVGAIRAQLPSSVDFHVDRVVDIETGPRRQRLVLAGGEVLESRLVVLATGMADHLREKVGMVRRVTFEKHSISFGFSIVPAPGESFPFPALTYYGEATEDRIDYLSLFPVGDVTRANLFTFRDFHDPWMGALLREPKATLLATLPGLAGFLGDFQVVRPVQSWVMDLCAVEDYRRDGVVLVGDAFQTSCPAAGTGMGRLLTDVERLCTTHLPRWLASEGMGAEKISEFYADTEKQNSDHRALKSSRYRRTLTVGKGVPGIVRRQREFLPRRLRTSMRAVGL